MSFDISALDTKTKSEEGQVMKLLSPKTLLPMKDDTGKEITITLRGRNSTAYKNAQRVVQDRRIERQSRGVLMSPEIVAEDDSEILAACTVTWDFTEMDGQPYLPTPENIKAFWSNDRFTWVAEQATRFVSNDGNFLAT